MKNQNDLRVTMPGTGEVILSSTISTGSAKNARRVTKTIAALFALGGKVHVRTARGWEPRVIVKNGSGYYTRTR
jgi:hypothetical protein